jgi:hypothetical protein
VTGVTNWSILPQGIAHRMAANIAKLPELLKLQE